MGKNEILLENSEKMKRNHEEIEREKLKIANDRLMSIESEGKKARSQFNVRMREQEKLRVNTENDKEGVEVLLAKKERLVNDLKEMVKKLEDKKVDEASLADKEKMI